ncbi:hypothetical protein ILYODFUR_030405, partial [Ilyodon furcidens]
GYSKKWWCWGCSFKPGPGPVGDGRSHRQRTIQSNLFQCMCGNNMSVPLLAEAVTVSGTEKETAAVSPT